ncbi:MAG TPA: ROK family transcriptional regulator [Acidimicrobiia bacterium]|nr:ROK family transcriptional regulator [Acidimicrobiia bacterium]
MPGNDLNGNGSPSSKGVAADELRRHNLAVVLTRLHLGGPVSRSELASGTGLNRSTIADLIGELLALGLVEERPGPAAAGPGRPSPVVHIRPEGAVVLAVELAVDSIAVATVGLGGRVYNLLRVERPREHLSPEEAVNDIANLARPLLASLPTDHTLVGVGVGVVGVTRRSDGFLHLAPNLGWRDVPLGELLTVQLEVEHPVLVANEADLGALAEHRRGVRPGVPNLIYVSGEVGIGTGVIVNGEPLLGSAGYAGEAGHTLVNPAGRACRCGAIGCWETEAGETALLRHAGSPLDTTGLSVLNTLSERAAAGDGPTLAAITKVGRWLGLGIGNLINLFNPDVVVLGGLFHRFYPFLEASVIQGARSRALGAPWASVAIVPSGLGTDAPLIGAAELALSDTIADPARVGRTPGRRPVSPHPPPDRPHRPATSR